MEIVTLKASTKYKPVTHRTTAVDPEAVFDVVVGGQRRIDYENVLLRTRKKMSKKLSKHDKTFIAQQLYVERPDEDVLTDTATLIITCVILVKT